ncbi:Uncharacterised protein [uncultured Comamonas sp.]|nr:Uncharacterised protein [uncultured Comamonas sp.]
MQWKDYISTLVSKGVTQSQLAKEAGCGQSTISDLASGNTKEPRSSLGMALMRIGKRHGIKFPKTILPSAPNKGGATSSQEVSHG